MKFNLPAREKYKKPIKWIVSPIAFITLVSGISITIAGFYFREHDLTSGGPGFRRRFQIIDGNGLIVLGILILACGIYLLIPKQNKKKS